MTVVLGHPALRPAWRQFVVITVITVALATAYGGITRPPFGAGALHNALHAIVIGTPLIFLECFWDHLPIRRFDRLPVSVLLLGKSAIYGLWIFLATGLTAFLVHGNPSATWEIFSHRDILVLSIAGALIINAVINVNRLLGPGMLFRFLIGRFYRGRREQRAFIFVDVCNSTQIASRIGDLAYYRYINQAIQLIEGVALANEGEIYEYIGDEVTVSWPLTAHQTGPLRFARELTAALDAQVPRFRRRFGETIAVRMGGHAGYVVAGEIGAARRKIAFIGDTVNTAARLEQLARDWSLSVVVSRPLLEHFPVPGGMVAVSLGEVPIRGRSDPIEVFSLEFADYVDRGQLAGGDLDRLTYEVVPPFADRAHRSLPATHRLCNSACQVR